MQIKKPDQKRWTKILKWGNTLIILMSKIKKKIHSINQIHIFYRRSIKSNVIKYKSKENKFL